MFTLTPLRFAAVLALVVTLATGRISAADGPPFKPGPAKIVVAKGSAGLLAPQGEFRGTVYFREVSEVATEVRGKVREVLFDDGDLVAEGQLLVRLDDQLLRKDLGAVKARLERDRTQLRDAENRLGRSENLVERGLSPLEQLDEIRFSVQGLRFSVAAAEAEVQRIETLIAKSEIHSPFDGIVLDRTTDLGEWKSEGQSVGVIARRGAYEIVIELPETSLAFVENGMQVGVQIGPDQLSATVMTVVPRGDVVTRTFPVKLRVSTDRQLMQGMAALANMPVGERIESLMVSRDAIVNEQGDTSVITVQDGVAHKHPVKVLGYQGPLAAISAPELGPGQLYAVKGHERLNTGDPVEVIPADAQPGV